MAWSYFWATICQKYLGLDLQINTKHHLQVPSTHTDFLKHIQNSENFHITGSDVCALLNKFVTVMFSSSTSKKQARFNEKA